MFRYLEECEKKEKSASMKWAAVGVVDSDGDPVAVQSTKRQREKVTVFMAIVSFDSLSVHLNVGARPIVSAQFNSIDVHFQQYRDSFDLRARLSAFDIPYTTPSLFNPKDFSMMPTISIVTSTQISFSKGPVHAPSLKGVQSQKSLVARSRTNLLQTSVVAPLSSARSLDGSNLAGWDSQSCLDMLVVDFMTFSPTEEGFADEFSKLHVLLRGLRFTFLMRFAQDMLTFATDGPIGCLISIAVQTFITQSDPSLPDMLHQRLPHVSCGMLSQNQLEILDRQTDQEKQWLQRQIVQIQEEFNAGNIVEMFQRVDIDVEQLEFVIPKYVQSSDEIVIVIESINLTNEVVSVRCGHYLLFYERLLSLFRLNVTLHSPLLIM
jgi:hypothetical protein